MEVAQSVSAADERIIFSCGDRDYTVRDLIDWTIFRGELEPLWKETLRGAEAEKDAHSRGVEPDYEALEKESVAFRYEHDLITAEETERWLEDRNLTLRDFSDYFARRYWSKASAATTSAEPDYAMAPAELRNLLIAELTFAGELDHMAARLSRRLAGQKAPKSESVDPELIAVERERFLQRTGASEAGLPKWLERHGRDSQWLDALLALEAAHRRDSDELLIGNAREREMSVLRMPLTRFETEVIEVESRDAAQEAIFCVRNDGMSLEEVAQEGQYPYQTTSLLLEDIDPSVQQKFLSVSMGEMLEPIPRGDGFQVCRVITKSEPSLEDPAVRNRVDQRIRERHFADLVTKHIDWRIPMASPE